MNSDLSSEKYDFSDNSLVTRLELLRGGRSQKEFAEWLGESVTTVNGYFTGASRPKIEFMRSLAKKGVNLNWFLTGVGPVYVDTGEETAKLSPEAQVFLMEMIQDGIPKDKLPGLMKKIKSHAEYQRHADATKEQIQIGYRIMKEQAKNKRSGK